MNSAAAGPEADAEMSTRAGAGTAPPVPLLDVLLELVVMPPMPLELLEVLVPPIPLELLELVAAPVPPPLLDPHAAAASTSPPTTESPRRSAFCISPVYSNP